MTRIWRLVRCSKTMFELNLDPHIFVLGYYMAIHGRYGSFPRLDNVAYEFRFTPWNLTWKKDNLGPFWYFQRPPMNGWLVVSSYQMEVPHSKPPSLTSNSPLVCTHMRPRTPTGWHSKSISSPPDSARICVLGGSISLQQRGYRPNLVRALQRRGVVSWRNVF